MLHVTAKNGRLKGYAVVINEDSNPIELVIPSFNINTWGKFTLNMRYKDGALIGQQYASIKGEVDRESESFDGTITKPNNVEQEVEAKAAEERTAEVKAKLKSEEKSSIGQKLGKMASDAADEAVKAYKEFTKPKESTPQPPKKPHPQPVW